MLLILQSSRHTFFDLLANPTTGANNSDEPADKMPRPGSSSSIVSKIHSQCSNITLDSLFQNQPSFRMLSRWLTGMARVSSAARAYQSASCTTVFSTAVPTSWMTEESFFRPVKLSYVSCWESHSFIFFIFFPTHV